MPVYDWTRVEAGIFHDFHLSWVTELRKSFNTGVLPFDYYALSEKTGGEFELEEKSELEYYIHKRRSLAIYAEKNHRITTRVEILSPGNKSSRRSLHALLNEMAGALAQGINLLLVDLHPHGPGDPHGIHAALWEELSSEGQMNPLDKPLTLAAYTAGPAPAAYVEPIAVGDVLPDMPLFLSGEVYIPAPLEKTYQTAFEGMPRFYRNILEA